MARVKTIEALKEAYKIAVDECGLSGNSDSALTREIGALITRFGAGQGAGVLQNLAREAKPSKGGARAARRPFIHPSLKKPELQAQAPVSKKPAPGQKPSVTLTDSKKAKNLPPVPESPASQNLEESQNLVAGADAIPPEEWKASSVNSLAKYGKDRLVATLTAAALPFEETYSERQLAKVLLDSLTPVQKS